MRFHNVYSVFAVILPVSLGLGLVYLTSVGRIDAYTAVLSTLAIAAVLGALVIARDAAASREWDDTYDR